MWIRWFKYFGFFVAGYIALVGLAWVFQRKLIYLPMGSVPAVESALPGGEEVAISTDDGLVLGGWYVPARTSATATVVVFNGNAGNRSFRAPLAEAFARMGFSALLFDYRGYGGNRGAPSEPGLVADARAAWTYLESRDDVDPDRIVYFGESLGAAVAVAAAVKRPPGALVLRSPFASLTAVGKVHYPFLPVRLLLKDRFRSSDRIGGLTCPLLVIAGDRDAIVPHSQSQALFDAAPAGRKRFVTVRGADHNDYELLAGASMMREIANFLAQALP